MRRLCLVIASFLVCSDPSSVLAQAEVSAIPPQNLVFYGGEETDWSVKATRSLTTTYHAKTPLEIPGARRISTTELKGLVDGPTPPLLIDVRGGDVKKHLMLPGAIFLGFEAGVGSKIYFQEKSRFEAALAKLSGDDKGKQIVFYCLNSECWLSYNAVLRAVEGGYKNVMWYRGGTVAWKAADYPFVQAQPFNW